MREQFDCPDCGKRIGRFSNGRLHTHGRGRGYGFELCAGIAWDRENAIRAMSKAILLIGMTARGYVKRGTCWVSPEKTP